MSNFNDKSAAAFQEAISAVVQSLANRPDSRKRHLSSVVTTY